MIAVPVNATFQEKINKVPEAIQKRLLGYGYQPYGSRAKLQTLRNWEQFGLTEAVDRSTYADIPIPEWLNNYQAILEEAVELYGRSYLDRLYHAKDTEVPELPSSYPWLTPGWHKYVNGTWVSSGRPQDGSTLCLDFETAEYQPNDWRPVCCGVWVVEAQTWYLWVTDFTQLPRTVSIGNNQVIYGHFIPYDRQYLTEEYLVQDSGNRFLDTMACWITVRGFCNQQKGLLKSELDWTEETAKNGLDSVYEFYTHQPLDKGVRDLIVNKGLPWITDNLPEVLKYCSADIRATHEVFRFVYEESLESQPSAVSHVAQLLLGSCWLPLSTDRWATYYDKAEACLVEVQGFISTQLTQAVQRVITMYQEDCYNDVVATLSAKGLKEDKLAQCEVIINRWVPNEQLAQLDWTPALSGANKGMPKWYRDTLAKPLTQHSRITPLILGVKWRGEPVLWADSDHPLLQELPKPKTKTERHLGGFYTKSYGLLPHPEDRNKAASDLFTKGFVHAVETGTLTADGEVTDLIKRAMSAINWVSLRKRVASIHTESPEGFPVWLPQVCVTGTVSRRMADNLSQVMANSKKTRIGTELKSMIEAPKGYTLVGADVDSQELWIGSLMADSVLGYCGSSPIGLSVLTGEKKDKTDVHSIVAQMSGIDRGIAKNMVYGGLYGQGVRGNTDLLLKELPDKSPEDCEKLAKDFLTQFKGDRCRHTRVYLGGVASDAFNEMEKIADSKRPRTPVLKAAISKALSGIKDFKTTRANWTIQSSGVDFRDILVLLQRFFYDRLGVQGRLLMTIHDEIRTVCREQDHLRAVWALQLAHLVTRAIFIDAFGLDCIPANVAWFSGVDVDQYLRKEPSDPCQTPSHPPLPEGRTITPHELADLLSF